MKQRFFFLRRNLPVRESVLVIWTLALFILAGGAMESRGEAVPSTFLKVFTKEEGGTTHFYVENLQVGNVTATFDLKLINLSGNQDFPYTVTVEGKKTVEVFNLSPTRKSVAWNYNYKYSCNLGSAVAMHDDAHIYELPYAAGSSYRVAQGHHGSFSHHGEDEFAIDWKMPEGTPVLAAREGLVVKSRDDSSEGGANRSFLNSANSILIQHQDGTIGAYVHLQQGGNKVQVGDWVQAGDVIGLSGNTGFTSGPHLHFAVFTIKNGAERMTLPVKFRTVDSDSLIPVMGHAYMAPPKALPPVAETPILARSGN